MDELKYYIVWEMDVKKYSGNVNKNESLHCILYRIQRIPQCWENLFHTKYISFTSSTTLLLPYTQPYNMSSGYYDQLSMSTGYSCLIQAAFECMCYIYLLPCATASCCMPVIKNFNPDFVFHPISRKKPVINTKQSFLERLSNPVVHT